MEEFDKGADLVLHNAYVTDGELNITNHSFFNMRNSKKGVFRNILKNSYMGCCMAFDRKMLKFILPVPASIPMHDQWIGIICDIYGTVKLVDMPLIYYRVHGGNVTGGETTTAQKIRWRRYLIRKLYKRVFLKR